MKKILFTVLFILCFSFFCFSQEDSTTTTTGDSFSLNLNQDSSFGFYPAVFGTITTKTQRTFTYYGIFWTNRAYALNDQNHWLEVGAGMGLLNGNWYFNPQIGITNGVLLSGASEGKFAEGVVPSMLILETNKNTELEIFGSYYKYIRKESDLASDFIFTWLYAGYHFTPKISGGLHAETFYQVTLPSDISYGVVGVYIKLLTAEKFSFRFSVGKNLMKQATYSRQFYRLGVSIPL